MNVFCFGRNLNLEGQRAESGRHDFRDVPLIFLSSGYSIKHESRCNLKGTLQDVVEM